MLQIRLWSYYTYLGSRFIVNRRSMLFHNRTRYHSRDRSFCTNFMRCNLSAILNRWLSLEIKGLLDNQWRKHFKFLL